MPQQVANVIEQRPDRVPDTEVVLTDRLIMREIESGSRVLDLGCGGGRLLERLRDGHRADVLGVERDPRQILAAVARGIPEIRADLDAGLEDFPDQSFDVAVLSQTLQEVLNPRLILGEMIRVASRALVVVPNFAHWKIRLNLLVKGRAPVTPSLPYEWYDTPNLHFLSMTDFRTLVGVVGARIVKELPIMKGKAVERAWGANLRAVSALYILERKGEKAARSA